MSDIFLSYATEDRERAGALALSLANHGWTVFWDRTIPAGKTWRQVIGAALDDARSVVVLWSRSSIQSDWVHEEADDGRERNVLIPVLIEDIRPPIGFRGLQAADLADWDGSDTFPAYRRLIGDLESLLGPSSADTEKKADQEAARKRAEDESRRKAEAEAARQEAEKETQRKAEQERAEAKRKAEEERRAKEQAELARAAERENAKREQAETENLSPEHPAAPPSAGRSKLPWIIAGAAAVVVGIGLAVYQPWKPSLPHVATVETAKPATAQETEPEPVEVVPETPEVEALDREMVALTNANIREGPGMEYGKVATLSRGASVAVSGHVEDWYRIALDDGGDGFVFKELLSESAPEAVKAAVAGEPLQPGETFRDCDICPEMVVVPPGSFLMGSPESEPERYDDEGPQHRVTIAKPFAVGVYEVTFPEWAACVDGGGCGGYRPGDEGWGRGQRPVINVSWDDARAYVQWLSDKTGKSYRLLTEAEWEYAARAGTTTPFHFGSAISTTQANYDGNYTYNDGAKGEYRRKTMPVGSFRANGFGLHDVHGNVWEWVADCYDTDAYKTHKNYPAMVGSWQDSCLRVLRGGSWNLNPWYLRSAYRDRFYSGSRGNHVGFRVARTL